jgi:hypothetical protein
MIKQSYKLDIINIPPETLELFKKIVENDLISYANEISKTQNISLDNILPIIPKIMEQPMLSKISDKYRDTSSLIFKKDLNRFTINDLKVIASKNQLAISGNKSELIDKISLKIGLRDITDTELKNSKSYISLDKNKQHIKKKKSPSNISNNFIEDSD